MPLCCNSPSTSSISRLIFSLCDDRRRHHGHHDDQGQPESSLQRSDLTQYADEITADEQHHVEFLRAALTVVGVESVARPTSTSSRASTRRRRRRPSATASIPSRTTRLPARLLHFRGRRRDRVCRRRGLAYEQGHRHGSGADSCRRGVSRGECARGDSRSQLQQRLRVGVRAGCESARDLSSRAQVIGGGDDVLISGFIIQTDDGNPAPVGSTPTKQIVMRGLGWSLAVNGQPLGGTLSDPTLSLRDANGMEIASTTTGSRTRRQTRL